MGQAGLRSSDDEQTNITREYRQLDGLTCQRKTDHRFSHNVRLKFCFVVLTLPADAAKAGRAVNKNFAASADSPELLIHKRKQFNGRIKTLVWLFYNAPPNNGINC